MYDVWKDIKNENVDYSDKLVGMKGEGAGESGIMTVDRYGNLVNITCDTIVEVSDDKDNPYNKNN